MTKDDIIQNTKTLMSKTVEHTRSEFGKIRTGRASATFVENIPVEVYGSKSPLNQIANISVPDARTILIQPWDKSNINAIEKAITIANLGFNPQNDGIVIRIPIPPLTEERRNELVKLCKGIAEEGKIAIRNIRREMNDILKKEEKSKNISEDEKKRLESEIQKITDEEIKNIESHLDKKEKLFMEDLTSYYAKV